MKISILGTGVYPIALTSLMKNKNILLYSKFPEETDKLSISHPNLTFTNNLDDLFPTDLFIIALPSQFIESTLNYLNNYSTDTPILIVSKGVLDNGIFLSNLINKKLNTNNISILSGPTFAEDLLKSTPTALTLATHNPKLISILRKIFDPTKLTIETTNDIYGVQFCGAIKNTIAIYMGILDGQQTNPSTKYKILTDILKDVQITLPLLGGQTQTMFTYAGLGDLLMTSHSTQSRNYNLGLLIGNKQNYQDYLKKNTVEGYHTIKSIYLLLQKNGLEIRFLTELYQLFYQY